MEILTSKLIMTLLSLKVTDVDLHEFREMIGPSQVLTSGEDDLSAFNTDWMRALR